MLEKDTLRNKMNIDQDKNSKYYKLLADFKFNKKYFKESIKQLKNETKRQPKSNKIDRLPKKWLPLKLYKSEYYVYCSGDDKFEDRILITNKYIFETNERGMGAGQFNSILELDDSTFANPEINYNLMECNLHIYIIDKQKGIAVFTSMNLNNNSMHYKLMVDAKKIRLLPLIKKCDPYEEVNEFNFDKPDFEKLIGIKSSQL